MKLSNKIQSILTEKLILRINELYHDSENKEYDIRHNYWKEDEKFRWKCLFEKYLPKSVPITSLDYGTGTGFVASIMSNYLSIGDQLICTDVSQNILNVCAVNLGNQLNKCDVSFIKNNGKQLPCEDNTVDIITINSVLHHIYDLDGFSQECYRVLKDGGLTIVVHEPNADTKLPIHFQLIEWVLTLFITPKNILFKIVESSTFLENTLRKILSKISTSYKHRNAMMEKISNQLIEEGLINFKLRGMEIQQLVDIQTEKGFHKEKLINENFKLHSLVEWKTYQFSLISSPFDKFLSSKFPNHGKSIAFVLQKRIT